MIRDYRTTDFEAVAELLRNEGWGRRSEDPERLRSILDAGTRTLVAEDGGEIVGFGRAVTDGVNTGYLSMIAVHRDHRRRGIGRGIVEELTGGDPRISWVLRAGREGSAAFWEAVGFRRSTTAMERPRIE